MNAEIWKPVLGYEGLYEASNFGRVRGLDRRGFDGRRLKGRVLRPAQNEHRRLHVQLCNGHIRSHDVHRLVLEAFVGPCPDGMECCHFPDRDPANCRLDNLQWGTKQINQSHKVIHGTVNQGERNGGAKLCETDIERIRDLRRAGLNLYEIADWIDLVTFRTVGDILRGENWKHI